MELREALVAAAREFNAGGYFEAHEVLEDALDDVPEEHWNLVLGLIQVAVGYHKATQRLWSGAARMLGIGLEKLEPLPVDAAGFRLEDLRRRARADREALASGRFDESEFRARPPRWQPLPASLRGGGAAGSRG
jgi:predicted metal-dependent hydrolase